MPNDWTFEGRLDLEEQSRYYAKMFEEGEKRRGLKAMSAGTGCRIIPNIRSLMTVILSMANRHVR